MRKFWYFVALLLSLLLVTLSTTHFATAETGSDWNSLLYASVYSDIWVQVSQTIQGTSTGNGPAAGCPLAIYNWDYPGHGIVAPRDCVSLTSREHGLI